MDDVEARFEQRWAERRGLLPPPPPPEPEGAANDPRRGSMRARTDGQPQARQDGPQHVQGPPAPDQQGPDRPARGVGSEMLGDMANTFFAAAQGVTQGGLEGAKPVEDEEITRALRPAGARDHTLADGDVDASLEGRLRAAQGLAEARGLDVVFRVGTDGELQAVQRADGMHPPGGRFGQIADAMGRMVGMNLFDPMGGGRTARGAAAAISRTAQ